MRGRRRLGGWSIVRSAAASWELVATVLSPLRSGVRRTTAETLIQVLNNSRIRCRLVAPFVDEVGVGYLTDAIVAATLRRVAIEVFLPVRSTNSEVAVGHLVAAVAPRGHRAQLSLKAQRPDGPWAHLKVLTADGIEAYIGSANLTGPGLNSASNLELGVLVRGPGVEAIDRLLDLIRRDGIGDVGHVAPQQWPGRISRLPGLATRGRHEPTTSFRGRNWSCAVLATHPRRRSSLGPPKRLPPPLVDPAPRLLNTHEMDWEDFEALIARIARRIEGAYDVHLYGDPGQKQDGLDVIGFFANQKPTAYQTKRVETLTPLLLEQAVRKFADGDRPFGANRLVVAVASEARTTQVLINLSALRLAHPDLTIELWDRRHISDELRDNPDMVEQFFGEATAAVFCTGGKRPSPPPTRSVSADAVMRGPVASLGLAEALRQAEAVADEHPEQSAALYDRIANQLEEAGYFPHALSVREYQASALERAGALTDEAQLRVTLAWRQLDAGDVGSASAQVQRLDARRANIPPYIARQIAALIAAVRIRRDYGTAIDELAQAFHDLQATDAHRADAALVLAEEAVTRRSPDVVQARSPSLLELAESMPHTDAGQLTAARIRICVADCTDNWRELATGAREIYSPAILSLVQARYARYLAMNSSDRAESVAAWKDAIERAVMQRDNDDAADWLYSLRTITVQRGWFGPGDDLNEAHRHALALRAAGGGSVLPEPYNARERGLSSLQDADNVRAIEELYQYLWHSCVVADWQGETDAHELLGDLFAKTNRGQDAVHHYIMAGEAKKVADFGSRLRDEPVAFPIADHFTSRPWEQVAAFRFVAACADLLQDPDAQDWCATALELIEGESETPRFAPNPWLAGFKAFAQLAEVSTPEQARRFLDLSSPLIERETGRYRHTDEDQIDALIGIGRTHADLQEEAVGQLVSAVVADERMAQMVLGKGQDLLRLAPATVVSTLEEVAANGNHRAVLALAAIGRRSASVEDYARQRFGQAIATREQQDGVMNFGTNFGMTASFVRLLPEGDRVRFGNAMLEFAQDRREPILNRQEALLALRTISSDIPPIIRTELFQSLVPFCDGEEDDDPLAALLPGINDPLGRVRISLGPTSLRSTGIMAAAGMAQSDEEYKSVQRRAVRALKGADDDTSREVAFALASLPADKVTLSVPLLASHPSQWLRALAAVLWARRAEEADEVGEQLSRDESRHVRGSLASSLPKDGRGAVARDVLRHDPRRGIRRLVDNSADGSS